MIRKPSVSLLLLLIVPFCSAFAAAVELPLFKHLENISSNTYGGNKRVWDIEFSDNGTIFVAASEQLCVWDGMDWHSYKSCGCIRDLYFDKESSRLYASGDNYFGYWFQDEYGRFVFSPLYYSDDNLNRQFFWKIIPQGNRLYVQTHENIYYYSLNENKLGDALATGHVGYIFSDGGDSIFGQVDGILYHFQDDEATSTGIRENDRIVEVRCDGDDIIYITELGGVRRLHNGISYDVFPKLNKTMQQQRVFSAKILDDGSYILGTVLDGAYVVSPDGVVTEHFNEENGMNYSTVLCMTCTGNGDFWFGLDGGVAYYDSKASDLLYYSKNKNIGYVYSSVFWNGHLYLGTNKGLYMVDSNRESSLVPDMTGVTWRLANCGEFMVAEIDNVIYAIYPNGHYEKIISNIWKFSSWEGIDNLYYCSDNDGIILLEKKDGKLAVRNRLENCKGFSRVPLKNDNMGNLWVDGLWGGVQRLALDKDKRRVVKSKFYPVGDKNTIVLAHYIDHQVVFTSKRECYVYDRDEDTVKCSAFYSNICRHFDSDIYSFYQQGNLYFNFAGGKMGVVARSGDTCSYLSGVFSRYEDFDFSENCSLFTELNDSLAAIGCNNGLILYNTNINNHHDYPPVRIVQFRYDVKGKTDYSSVKDNDDVIVPYNATNLTIQLSGLSKNRTVYYSIDGHGKCLIRKHSYINLPYLSPGSHHICIYNGTGDLLLSMEMKIRSHWTRSWWFLLTTIVLSLFIILFFLMILKHRTVVLKRKYSLKQAEMMERERIKYENEKLSLALHERNAKLTTLAINDITVNNMLKEIENELNKASEGSNEIRTAVRPVKKVIERYFRENGSWEAFETYFNGVYDGFFDRLKTKYPQLTQNEVKICSYIRLGMSTKEIASLMNIEVSSAESARYRLRKNMGLASNESLSNLISGI